MAGAGFKEFQSESVLTATQVNTYLMQQSVMNFSDTSAASAQIVDVNGSSLLSEGMVVYSQQEERLFVRNGSGSWDRVGTKDEIDSQEARSGQILVYMEVIN